MYCTKGQATPAVPLALKPMSVLAAPAGVARTNGPRGGFSQVLGDSTWFPATYVVDYIKVYHKANRPKLIAGP